LEYEPIEIRELAISRVLSRIIIHLWCLSPDTYSDLPELNCGQQHKSSYLVLLRVGFTLPFLLPVTRCALTAPFHPYLILTYAAVSFLLHLP